MSISWKIKSFDQLSLNELYGMLQLRAMVFVVEQNCVYQDIDEKDKDAIHVLGYSDGKLVAYARCYTKENIMVIGRVIVAKEVRGQGLGKELIQQCLHYIGENLKTEEVMLAAQYHLQKFYAEFGFVAKGEPFTEEGILHIDMHLEQKVISS